jgi:hypothetical protein
MEQTEKCSYEKNHRVVNLEANVDLLQWTSSTFPASTRITDRLQLDKSHICTLLCPSRNSIGCQ